MKTKIIKPIAALLLAASAITASASATIITKKPMVIGTMKISAIVSDAVDVYKDTERVLELMEAKREKLARLNAPEEEVEEAAEAPVMTYIGTYRVTGYDVCAKCCGNSRGITASGTTATVGRTCAAPKDLPFGTQLYIDGIGYRTVEDRGGAVNGKTLDILCEDHPACYALTGYYDVYIVEDGNE